jgi:hypothetical protein
MKFDLRVLTPSQELLDFYNNYDSFEDAWNACPRGDWMLSIAAKLDVDKRILTLAKSRCTRTVIHLMEHEKSRNAVEVSELSGLGKASKEELYKAYQDAGYASAYDNASAAYAAGAAPASAYDNASSAAYDNAVATTTARVNNQQQTADICRELLTELVFKQINQTL